ncbi:DUF3089 domain-containing protein [Sphingomonas bacterium]|uniref:DUF3089 domain-containing protein n=1 Tax=Sphingomonas bacterium TaxID=1895847 RepID=UPI0015755721|nr:DUF3089 domain-containing protein [Sphingomonas bacterium]
MACLAATPAGPGFDATPPPPAPDYALASNWAVRDIQKQRRVDVFYIQPTTFRSKQLWNQDVTDAETNRWTDVSVGARQISLFADCCRAFSPRYRQASSRAFVEEAGDGAKAYDLAYQDVRRAFRHYIAIDNGGRPFIIAGHSQGALQGLRLLREEIAGTPLAGRLVVAYLPGLGIPTGLLPPGIPACTTPRQTGCIASWNSFDADADTKAYVAHSLTRDPVPLPGATLVCTNPLTFDTGRPAGDFADARGTLPAPAVAGPLPPLRPHMVAARCDGGVLRVTVKPGLPVPDRVPGGILHMEDIAFFWDNIRADAVRRAAAWRDTGRNR